MPQPHSSRLLWLFFRLRAMERGEVRYRIGQVLLRQSHRIRNGLMRPGKQVRIGLGRWDSGGAADPALGSSLRTSFARHFPAGMSAVEAEANGLCEDRIRLFGVREVNLGDPRRRNSEWLRLSPTESGPGRAERNIRLLWELNRLHHWPRLALAYFLTGTERYQETLKRQVGEWLIQNPPYRGPNWRSAMEVGIRAQNWLWTIRILGWNDVGGEVADALGQPLEEHVAFVARHLSRYSSANNHLLVEAATLAILAREMPRLRDSSHLRGLGLRILMSELPRQVHRDGCTAEQAFRYHALVLEQLLLLLAAGGDIPNEIVGTTEKMAYFLADLISDGNVPIVGDSDDGRILRLTPSGMTDQELVGLAGKLIGRPDLKGCGQWGQSAFWITRRLEENGTPSMQRKAFPATTHYPDGGYTLIRSRGRRQRLLFDHGPLGLGTLAAHGHADSLSVLVWMEGKPLVIDSGTYLYGVAPYREWFRSTSAHNTVAIDGRDQSETLGPFLWGRRALTQVLGLTFWDEVDVIEASHDGYRPAGHRRSVVRVGDDLIIVSDAVTSPRASLAVASLHFAPDVKPLVEQERIQVADSCLVIPILPDGCTWRLEPVPFAPAFCSLSTTHAMRAQVPVCGTTIFHTIFAFAAIPNASTAGGWLHVKIPSGTIHVALGPANDDQLRFDGQAIFISAHHDGTLRWAFGREVRELRIRGQDFRAQIHSLANRMNG